MNRKISVVITDLDNTLYDWVDSWYRSFSSMLGVIVRDSGLRQDLLEREIRKIFQKYGSSEYSFLIEEIPSLQTLHPGEDLKERYKKAITAYGRERKKICLYPFVKDTLQYLKQKGCLIVAFTESQKFYTIMRMKNLGLDEYFDFVFSPNDVYSTEISIPDIRYGNNDYYSLKHAVFCPIKKGEYKPDPKILTEILSSIKASGDETIYIGDSLMKDILMAQAAGVTDVHAKYGLAHNTQAYELLRRVSHWTDEDVLRDKQIHEKAGEVTPTFTLNENFGEILKLFDFIDFKH